MSFTFLGKRVVNQQFGDLRNLRKHSAKHHKKA